MACSGGECLSVSRKPSKSAHKLRWICKNSAHEMMTVGAAGNLRYSLGTSGIHRITVGRYRDHADPMQIVSSQPGREVVHLRGTAFKRRAGSDETLPYLVRRRLAGTGLGEASVAALPIGGVAAQRICSLKADDWHSAGHSSAAVLRCTPLASFGECPGPNGTDARLEGTGSSPYQSP